MPREKKSLMTKTSLPGVLKNALRRKKNDKPPDSSQTKDTADQNPSQSNNESTIKAKAIRNKPKMAKTIVDASTIPDLKHFQYKSTNTHRPHIKIEYELNSPDEEMPKGLWEPPHWSDFLLNLRSMRANNDAPVDSMGCHMTMDHDATPKVMRYQSLIALMLSSQTKDQVTFAAMEKLRAKGLTVDNVLKMSDEELGQLIYPVGFWKTKVKYIKKTTQTLKEQYNGDIPDSVEKLCKLTGVGPKMAHICMKVAWNKITGIGVDTHVHRISNRIGWVKKPTSTPEDTRKALQSWLPFDLWSEVNHLMVGFGQTICLPVGPLCYECLNNDICPSSDLGRKTPKKTPGKTPNKTTPSKAIKEEEILHVKKELDLDKPVKSPRSTKAILRKEMNEENDDEVEVKKELLSVIPNKTEKSPRKRKLTPKKEVNAEEQNEVANFEEINEKLSMKPKKTAKLPCTRKVTPKKEEDQDDFEEKKENLSIKPEKITRAKKITPNKKANVEQENIEDFDIQKDSLSVKSAEDKTSAKKIKITPSNKVLIDEDQKTEEGKKIVKTTRSNKRVDGKLVAKESVKKKSPRSKTKNEKQNDESSMNTIENKVTKITKATKK